MQPADIYESECLGTNAVHYQVNKVLAAMSVSLNNKSAEEKYIRQANIIKKGMQDYLWQPAKGYYGQYLYGRNFKSLSPRSEALGEALTVYFDIADPKQQQRIVNSTPVNEFGIPCIYPQIPGIPPYHNKAVWPFVETFWAMASAKAGNEASLIRAISAIYRPAALFLTNKENFVVSDGDYAGTQINSSNMLWSLSGNIALVYKILFGIRYNEESLQFKPFVPIALAGERSLTHFKYRKAFLNIDMQGYGNKVASMTIDGKIVTDQTIPADLVGGHTIKINLADNIIESESKVAPDYTAPETPVVTYQLGKLSWPVASNATAYNIFINGKKVALVNGNTYPVTTSEYAEYQVASVDAHGVSSFNSEPIEVIPAKAIKITEAESAATASDLKYKSFSGLGSVEISKTKNTTLNIPINVTSDGVYAIDFKYANGNGPINTENKCAIRTLNIDDHFAGTVVFPQRGKGEWTNLGYSNGIKVRLTKGKYTVSLQLKDANENMNGDINQAMIDYLRIIRISGL